MKWKAPSGKIYEYPDYYKKVKGVDPKEFAVRTCLRCDTKFDSLSKVNRICKSCKDNIQDVVTYQNEEEL